ncbi:hypothetical protein ASC77_02125 [Nocardioides sp. Root1257]|uniref:STAS domain-containing protein n=1 Tax=unclassified Nocardioides TaxID=2615069 RepID=UPI0006F2C4EB|nr:MULTISPECIES: STAS domain-containing protein [unclassified Nocardioides]KQW53119.1 hypothetical protein ASC77_02125 [Nocardioides sp. Root1257]KRC55807.1 hypothetical protein ASE24_02125 [Nocardioides sp. Root224]
MDGFRPDHGPLSAAVDLRAWSGADVVPSVDVHFFWLGSWTIVRVVGEMDIQARELIDRRLDGEVGHLVFELDGVTFMDACGLGVLLDRLRRAREADGVVYLVAPSAPVLRLLELTDSARLFPPIVAADRAVAFLQAADPWTVF